MSYTRDASWKMLMWERLGALRVRKEDLAADVVIHT